MRRMAHRARDADIDVIRVLLKACIRHNLAQVVTLRAEPIGTVRCEIRIREQVRNRAPGRGRLADFVTAFQDVHPLRSMWTIRSCPAKFAIVVGVMAISTENPRSHGAAGSDSIQQQHLTSQARLW